MTNEAAELINYMDNTDILYPQRVAIEKSLNRKIKAGKFDPNKSVKLWLYWVENGAKEYCKDYGGTWHVIFSTKIRLEAATYIANNFISQLPDPRLRDFLAR